MGKPHILAIPYPAQGHVMPLMKVSQCLVKHGLKVIFVNTDYSHKRVVNAMAEENHLGDPIHLVSIPDGMEPSGDRNDHRKLVEAMLRTMPGKLKELIEDINTSEGDQITGVIADYSMGWALELAEKMKILRASFWPASIAVMASFLHIPKLIESGIINSDGTSNRECTIHLAPNMPTMTTTNLVWTCAGDLTTQNFFFKRSIDFTIFDQTQFRELALGLEQSNKAFLWVVRPDTTRGPNDAYPKGFLERVVGRGWVVGWAPQQKVLSHPSIACFLSHCGWNSTIEGVSNGVPFLCWPYFAYQFINQSYICDVWKIGLKFKREEIGIIKRGEIKRKVENLLGDENFKTRALDLQEIVSSNVKEGGSSDKNLKNFIEWLNA